MSTHIDRIRITLGYCLQMLALNDQQQELLNLTFDGEESPLRSQVREALNELDALTAECAGANPDGTAREIVALVPEILRLMRQAKNKIAPKTTNSDADLMIARLESICPIGLVTHSKIITETEFAERFENREGERRAALDRVARDAEEKGLHWNPDLENRDIVERLTHRLVTIVATLDCSRPIIGHGMLKEITGIAREVQARRKA